jgi:hypothetical protein
MLLRSVDAHRLTPVARPRLRDLDVMPSRSKVFTLSDADRKLVQSGPALVGANGHPT